MPRTEPRHIVELWGKESGNSILNPELVDWELVLQQEDQAIFLRLLLATTAAERLPGRGRYVQLRLDWPMVAELARDLQQLVSRTGRSGTGDIED